MNVTRAVRRWLGHEKAWGAASQAMSSATNFLLSVVAGRLLGPAGLGVVALSFSIYLLCLGFHRALVTDPLVVTSAPAGSADRAARASRAAVLTVLSGLAVSAFLGIAALLLPAPWGGAAGALAPWLPLLLLQDLWRSVLFRDRRPVAGALLDLIWVLAMAGTLPVALLRPSAATAVTVWGLGGALGAVAGWWLAGGGWDWPRAAVTWWREEASSLGRWLALEGVVFSAGTWAATALVTGLLGAEALGALRAVQSLFAPMSLVGPALALPGLPALARSLRHDAQRARREAFRLSLTAAAASGGYVAVFLAFPGVLTLVFGASFHPFGGLILPVALGQLVVACALGPGLVLKAARRGAELVWLRAVQVGLGLTAVVVAAPRGLVALAWIQLVASAVLVPVYVVAGLRSASHGTREPVIQGVRS